MKQEPKGPGSVSFVLNPGPKEQWSAGMQAAQGSGAAHSSESGLYRSSTQKLAFKSPNSKSQKA